MSSQLGRGNGNTESRIKRRPPFRDVSWTLNDLHNITGGTLSVPAGWGPSHLSFQHIWYDTRRILPGETARKGVFWAFRTPSRDGATFIPHAQAKGVRLFVCHLDGWKHLSPDLRKNSAFLVVKDTWEALYTLAKYLRTHRFAEVCVVLVAGTHAKTTWKETLFEWLAPRLQGVYRSPASWNSLLGLCLSLFYMPEDTHLAFLEVDPDTPQEAHKILEIAQPDVLLLTGYHRGILQMAPEQQKALDLLKTAIPRCISVAEKDTPDTIVRKLLPHCRVSKHISVPVHAGVLSFPGTVQETRVSVLPSRIRVEQGIFGSVLIQDLRSPDPLSVIRLAEFARVLLSSCNEKKEFRGAGVLSAPVVPLSEEMQVHLVRTFLEAFPSWRWEGLLLVGFSSDGKTSWKERFPDIPIEVCPSPDFLEEALMKMLRNLPPELDACVVHVARRYVRERWLDLLRQSVHRTVLEVDIHALYHNLQVLRSWIPPRTGIIAMLKAGGYGGGAPVLAHALQNMGVDYLGLAYVDEGRELRRKGIHTPILIFNADTWTVEDWIQYRLEPVIATPSLLQRFLVWVPEIRRRRVDPIPVHLEVDTGFRRLGFSELDIADVVRKLEYSGVYKLRTVFTHLMGAENPRLDTWTYAQWKTFERVRVRIDREFPALSRQIRWHILNTAGIVRFPQWALDYVRPGIGLYGVDPVGVLRQLQPVYSFRARVLMIRTLARGDSIGYSRSFVADVDSLPVAIVSAGYGDGIPPHAGRERLPVFIRGGIFPLIGNPCMDVSFVDLREARIMGISVHEGDEVEFFGRMIPVQEWARRLGWSAYHLFTGLKERVRRIYTYG